MSRKKWSGLEWIFLCNAGASFRNNSLLKTTMFADIETCLTTACIFSPSAQSVPSLWWISNKIGQSRPGVALNARANSSTKNPTLFAAVVTIWLKKNTLETIKICYPLLLYIIISPCSVYIKKSMEFKYHIILQFCIKICILLQLNVSNNLITF